MITIKQILKAIDCSYLNLYRAPEGYFYFVYDRPESNIWSDESVYVYRLNHLEFDRWVEIGKAFVEKVEEES